MAEIVAPEDEQKNEEAPVPLLIWVILFLMGWHYFKRYT